MNAIRWGLMGLAGLLLASCTQPPVPQDHYYRLQVAGPSQAVAEPRLKGVLEVEDLQADGLTAGRPITFTDATRPYLLNEYHYHFWTEPPSILLRDALVTFLRTSGVAREVVTPELRLEPDFVLTGKVLRLEQVRGPAPKVAAKIEVALRDRAQDRLLLVKTYEVENEVAGPSVGDAVVGLNAAVSEIYGRLVADISAL